ncbi:MAG: asparaginase [Flavobacteriales bacterium]|nr:asparaginase [Flavobacteriales bacterium]MCB9449415.1 asparaginase [Flavobacteriales bacterium]
MSKKKSILLIYTGGTIGMVQDTQSGSLRPFDFTHLTQQIPELTRFDLAFSSHSFAQPMDSSNMTPEVWIKLAQIIEEQYDRHDGFVILHGSDTMAYTASALSFLLENLAKPVILTGSQLPIGIIRTDARENLITAIEIASSETPLVPEVCIYFEYHLYRGNRTSKINAEEFAAFHSFNHPPLASAGVHLKFHEGQIAKWNGKPLQVHRALDPSVAILKIFPGIQPQVVDAMLSIPGLKGLILETYGAGNAPTDAWLSEKLEAANKRGLVLLNITQCLGGSVEQGRYETSVQLEKAGVISGKDMTTEAAIAKLMFLLAQQHDTVEIKRLLTVPLCGEMHGE